MTHSLQFPLPTGFLAPTRASHIAADAARTTVAAAASSSAAADESELLRRLEAFLQEQPKQISDTNVLSKFYQGITKTNDMKEVKLKAFLKRFPGRFSYSSASATTENPAATVKLIAKPAAKPKQKTSKATPAKATPSSSPATTAAGDSAALAALLDKVVTVLQAQPTQRMRVDDLNVLTRPKVPKGEPAVNGQSFSWERFALNFRGTLKWHKNGAGGAIISLVAQPPRRQAPPAQPPPQPQQQQARPAEERVIVEQQPPPQRQQQQQPATTTTAVGAPAAAAVEPAAAAPSFPLFSSLPLRQALFELALECRGDWRLRLWPGGAEPPRMPAWWREDLLPLNDAAVFDGVFGA